MNNKIKYIYPLQWDEQSSYFEIYSTIGSKINPRQIQNANVLLIKPKTNSYGCWGFTNITHNAKMNYDVIVDQYWIDLHKYEFGIDYSYAFDDKVLLAIDIIKKLLNNS